MNLLERVSKQHNKWVKLALKLGAGSYAEDIIQEVYLRLHQYSSLSKVLNKENKIQFFTRSYRLYTSSGVVSNTIGMSC